MKKAFTLIELLVVVALIAILISLVLGAVQVVKEKARKQRVYHDIHQLHTAWTVYIQDYKHVPEKLAPSNSIGEFWMGSNAMAVLRGVDWQGQNPQGIKYMDFSPQTLWFCDTWGVRNSPTGVYRVVVDHDYDNRIEYNFSNIFVTVGVWSTGPDRQPYTDDDLTSWKR